MKFTKKIVLSSVLALGLLSQATIGSAVGEPTGQLTVTLAGDESGGALTLLSVADLSGQINITDNNNKIAPLTKTGDIKISDTRPQKDANPWHLSVKVNQPTERGTGAFLEASGISFDIDVASNGNTELESINPESVLEISAEVLSGQYSAVIPADVITSELTLEDEFSSKAKGVYQNTIIYTLTEDVPATNPNAPSVDKGSDDITNAGDSVEFAGTDWRILKVDGNKALVIKENALTTNEATGQGATDDYYTTPFLSATATGALGAGSSSGQRGYYYFDSDGSNGYEDSGLASGYGLKSVIDYYYGTIPEAAKNYVLPVNLNNPSHSDYISTVDSGKGAYGGSSTGYNNGNWGSYYQDKRFATTLDGSGSKQAFALSYGDINDTMGLSGSSSTDLFDFSSSNVNYFWLRSAGHEYRSAGLVYTGYFNRDYYVYQSRPVRPALWLSLGS